MNYYHVTTVESLSTILEKGIISNGKEELLVFSPWEILNPSTQRKILTCDIVAAVDCIIGDFAVVELSLEGIDKGGLVPYIPTDDKTLYYLWEVKQAIIKPEYIRVKTVRSFDVIALNELLFPK